MNDNNENIQIRGVPGLAQGMQVLENVQVQEVPRFEQDEVTPPIINNKGVQDQVEEDHMDKVIPVTK